MATNETDTELDEFLEIRKPGAHLSETVAEEFVLDIDVDLENFVRFPRLDDSVTYPKAALDIRHELVVDPAVDLPDYAGPFKPDLRFTDFSTAQLVRMLEMSAEYLRVCLDAWRGEVARRKGEAEMLVIDQAAWDDTVRPELERMTREFLPPSQLDSIPGATEQVAPIDYRGPFVPVPADAELTKEELVTKLLGSHEYLLQCIEAWATQITLRDGLDEMFSIQWAIWSDVVLPAVKQLKADHTNLTEGTNPVGAFMKDLQVDASAFPGKAFDCSFEMPEEEVGILTFNRCVAADQWESLGRPDILEKNCHSTCPASLIETARMYDPDMVVDILAIPPRVDKGDVCCKWRLRMRTAEDPEYVPVTFTTRPQGA